MDVVSLSTEALAEVDKLVTSILKGHKLLIDELTSSFLIYYHFNYLLRSNDFNSLQRNKCSQIYDVASAFLIDQLLV